MAQDSEKPTAADKGKGKAVEESKKEKSQVNGKKDDEKIIDCERHGLSCDIDEGLTVCSCGGAQRRGPTAEE